MLYTLCYDWLVGGSLLPKELAEDSDVSCSIQVGVQGEPTIRTPIPDAFTVASPNVSASAAPLTRVPGVDVLDNLTQCFRFVLQETLELTIRPVPQSFVEASTIGFGSANIQLLQNKQVSIAFGNLFAQTVVHIPHKPSLSATQTLQMTLGGRSAFTLEGALQPLNTSFDCPKAVTVKEPVIACDHRVDDSPVDSDSLGLLLDFDLFRRGCFSVKVKQNPIIFDAHSSSTNLPSQITLEILWDFNGQLDSPKGSGHGDDSTIQHRLESVVVESDAGELSLHRQSLQLLTLQHIAGLVTGGANETTIQLRELFTNPAISEVVQFGLVECFLFESSGQTLVADDIVEANCILYPIIQRNFKPDSPLHDIPLDSVFKYANPLGYTMNTKGGDSRNSSTG
jgi:hypothetical protein